MTMMMMLIPLYKVHIHHKGTCTYFLNQRCYSKLCCSCCNNHIATTFQLNMETPVVLTSGAGD